jgi:hypothetical protein
MACASSYRYLLKADRRVCAVNGDFVALLDRLQVLERLNAYRRRTTTCPSAGRDVLTYFVLVVSVEEPEHYAKEPMSICSAPRRNRTYNLVIKSHLLCQLS